MDMMRQISDKLSEMATLLQAQIQAVDINSTFELQTFDLTLTTAVTEQNPFVIGFPFKSIAFSDATDNSTYVNAKFNKNDSSISTRKFKDNSSLSCDGMFTKCFLSWPAQSGKVITVTVFLRSRYESGALINSGIVTNRESVNTTLAGNSGALSATPSKSFVVPAGCSFKGVLSWQGVVATGNANVMLCNNGTNDIVASTDINPLGTSSIIGNDVNVVLPAGSYTLSCQNAFPGATGRVYYSGTCYNNG